MGTHLVFFYGTLKSDQPNHVTIKKQVPGRCRLVGEGRTESRWPLVIASKFNAPFLLAREGEGKNIRGEIYEMDDEALKMIDTFEGYPGLYNRAKVRVKVTRIFDDFTFDTPTINNTNMQINDNTNTTMIDCWLYTLTKYRSELVDFEKYEVYDSAGAHGKTHLVLDSEGRFIVNEEELRRELLYWCTPEGSDN